ncbi:hypothetical protein PCL1606_26920 [Pseudomonas chlororaphis]|uniref:Uncharacterized protein n=1 Tax=Pseudomonas chlororaphis TaxID=587753 RepID=A0A0D5XYJ2_9PSED|nr:hypothetical protein PCL1606_26920 [Pseudomonas chlororaphis]
MGLPSVRSARESSIDPAHARSARPDVCPIYHGAVAVRCCFL